MSNTGNDERVGSRSTRGGAQRGLGTLLAALVVGSLGCGTQQADSEAEPANGQQRSGMRVANRLLPDSLSPNRLQPDGLAPYGLSEADMTSTHFRDWFEADPAEHALLMEHVVSCAVPDGQTRSYTSPVSGERYSWGGQLGLAPGWTSGSPMNLEEQQLVSACLGARVNKFGEHVIISLRALDANGTPLPTPADEVATFTQPEGCFFGNVFASEPMRVGNDGLAPGSNQSTLRVCALPPQQGETSQCEPLVYVGSCTSFCTKDPTGTFYEECVYEGQRYRPMTTWLTPGDIATCGDGLCDASEVAGMPGYCAADCS